MKQVITLKDLVALAEKEGIPQDTLICVTDEECLTIFTEARVFRGDKDAAPVIELR